MQKYQTEGEKQKDIGESDRAKERQTGSEKETEKEKRPTEGKREMETEGKRH